MNLQGLEGGTYRIKVHASAPDAPDDEMIIATDVADPAAPPVAGFLGTPTTGTVPLTVAFTDGSTGVITVYTWDFGDSTISNEQNPEHQYNAVGTYSVNLTVTGPGGSNTTTKFNYVRVHESPPIAGFSGTPTSGTVPLTVEFTDLSSNNPSGWAWYFGDENFTAPWMQQTAHAGWTARDGQCSVAMPDSSIILIGYDNISGKGDVWRSSDYGGTWRLINANTGLVRGGHNCVVASDGSILLMGGINNEGNKNDVWRSINEGLTWTLVNASAGWSGRYEYTSVVTADGSIVIMGGAEETSGSPNELFKNDVWRSTDNGTTWTQMTASAEWLPRGYHTSVVMPDDSIILIGGATSNSASGLKNDTWRSTDYGATWTQMTPSAGWAPKLWQRAVAIPDGSIIFVGSAGHSYNDVWRSIDNGTSWTLMNIKYRVNR